MQAVAGGDFEAFDEIVLRYQQHAWRTAYRFLSDAMDAEDVAQEALLRVFEAAPRYRPTSAFRTYLYTIVYRLCIDRTRKIQPAPSDEIWDIPALSPNAAEDLLSHERREEIQRALARLTLHQRTAIVLRHYEGLSYAEIAQVMGATTKAVEMLIRRARETLQSQLAHLKKA